MDRPAGYELHAPTPDDLDGVAEVLIADDLDDAGQSLLDADFLRDEVVFDYDEAHFEQPGDLSQVRLDETRGAVPVLSSL